MCISECSKARWAKRALEHPLKIQVDYEPSEMHRSWTLKDRARTAILHRLSNAKHCTAGTCPSAPCISPADLPQPARTTGKHPHQEQRAPISARYCHRAERADIAMRPQPVYCMHQAFNRKQKNDVYLTWVMALTGCWQCDNSRPSSDSYPGVNCSVIWNLNHATSVQWLQNTIQNQFLPSPRTWRGQQVNASIIFKSLAPTPLHRHFWTSHTSSLQYYSTLEEENSCNRISFPLKLAPHSHWGLISKETQRRHHRKCSSVLTRLGLQSANSAIPDCWHSQTGFLSCWLLLLRYAQLMVR